MIKKAIFSALLAGIFMLGGVSLAQAQSAEVGHDPHGKQIVKKDPDAVMPVEKAVKKMSAEDQQKFEEDANPQAYALKKEIASLEELKTKSAQLGEDVSKFDRAIVDLRKQLNSVSETGTSNK